MSVKELLSKDVSLKKNTYPSKKTMNFVENNEAKNNRTALIVFGVFLVFLVLFTKFGVIDRISETNALMSQYQTNSKQLDALKEELKDYDAIEEKYNALVGSFLSEGERNCLNRTALLKMVDEDILPQVSVANISISDNKMSVYTSLTDLNTISRVVDILQKDERTSYVTVSSTVSDSEDSSKVSATIEITCQNEGGNE